MSEVVDYEVHYSTTTFIPKDTAASNELLQALYAARSAYGVCFAGLAAPKIPTRFGHTIVMRGPRLDAETQDLLNLREL